MYVQLSTMAHPEPAPSKLSPLRMTGLRLVSERPTTSTSASCQSAATSTAVQPPPTIEVQTRRPRSTACACAPLKTGGSRAAAPSPPPSSPAPPAPPSPSAHPSAHRTLLTRDPVPLDSTHASRRLESVTCDSGRWCHFYCWRVCCELELTWGRAMKTLLAVRRRLSALGSPRPTRSSPCPSPSRAQPEPKNTAGDAPTVAAHQGCCVVRGACQIVQCLEQQDELPETLYDKEEEPGKEGMPKTRTRTRRLPVRLRTIGSTDDALKIDSEDSHLSEDPSVENSHATVNN
ncbi:hypothetical protein B0H12DRAFT_80368 [Mycena haematopus]|nr:hypothetical protein B0H12DRAFT_80368 [Mycena haematopus]